MDNSEIDVMLTVALLRRFPDPLDRLAGVASARLALDAAATSAVLDALAEGATWQDIGDSLGMTRQSAHARWASTAVALGL